MKYNRTNPQDDGRSAYRTSEDGKSIIIPVIQEHVTIDKEVVETGKVRIRTTVTEEDAQINIPLIHESYEVERVPVQQVLDKAPSIRYEGDTIIVPVTREVVVVEKRYELVEEVRLTRRTTTVPHLEQVTLLKENVQVERTETETRGNAHAF